MAPYTLATLAVAPASGDRPKASARFLPGGRATGADAVLSAPSRHRQSPRRVLSQTAGSQVAIRPRKYCDYASYLLLRRPNALPPRTNGDSTNRARCRNLAAGAAFCPGGRSFPNARPSHPRARMQFPTAVALKKVLQALLLRRITNDDAARPYFPLSASLATSRPLRPQVGEYKPLAWRARQPQITSRARTPLANLEPRPSCLRPPTVPA